VETSRHRQRRASCGKTGKKKKKKKKKIKRKTSEDESSIYTGLYELPID
jgi:hypothetical protein